MAVPPRDLSPFLRWFRKILLGREFKNSLRFQDKVATRSPEAPILPDGPSHKLSENYYFTRDARHTARPPLVLSAGIQKKAVTDGMKGDTASKAVASKTLKTILPGISYKWQEVPEEQRK
ncbi:NADH dehydrogenase [ubiquinone] 1 alpha subcomplex subunit 7-like [Uloborus diversus]|uniref:NADH dehydrogenase [ubiquinone] 1 alpha subcomplex subunit 7-like n=1 Tax=Uloborus diversus TaxID=327109 RepID=UPI00240A2E93|nr:NADH dehydrogenase [ubiquinone] 1 alpha subcomplex subunit 7-like [Uloborus diversus]